jgi:uncharacterized membrane protein YphA (DoxX/SURF4 family)
MKSIFSFFKKIFTSEYLSLALRLYIGWVFIDAGVGKVVDPALFAENIASYRIIPFWGINLAAVYLPWLELICGFFLIFGLRIKAAAAVSGGLLFMFTLFVVVNVLQGSKINCGCYDTVGDLTGWGEPIGWKKVMENTIWLVMTVQVFFFDRIQLFSRRGIFWKREVWQG